MVFFSSYGHCLLYTPTVNTSVVFLHCVKTFCRASRLSVILFLTSLVPQLLTTSYLDKCPTHARKTIQYIGCTYVDERNDPVSILSRRRFMSSRKCKIFCFQHGYVFGSVETSCKAFFKPKTGNAKRCAHGNMSNHTTSEGPEFVDLVSFSNEPFSSVGWINH